MDKTLDEQIADAVAVALSASGTPPVPPGLSANVDFGKLWEQAARLNLDLGLVHALATQVAAEDGSQNPPDSKHYRIALDALLFQRHTTLDAYRAVALQAQQAIARELLGAA